MLTASASLGEDGGSRCRNCAAQDRPYQWGLEEYNIMALPVVKVYNPSGSVVGTAVGDDVNEVKSYVAPGEEWLIGRVSRPLRFS